MRTLIFFVLLSFSALAQAGIGTNLKTFYHSAGGTSNYTQSQAMKSQWANGWGGLSLSARTPVSDTTLFSVTGPGIRAGCAGIDMHLGAISMIRSDQLRRALRQVLNNVASYAFMIAFETICPMCKKQMDQLNKLLQELNQMSVNHCDAAVAVVGTVMQKNNHAKAATCSHLGAATGMISDYGQGLIGCGQEKGKEIRADIQKAASGVNDSELSEGQKKLRPFVKQFADTGNLAWWVINDSGLIDSHGKDLSEIIMNLSGTIILLPGTLDSSEWRSLPSMASNEAFLRALVGGDTQTAADEVESLTAPIWRCDTDDKTGCLHPTSKVFTLSEGERFLTQIRKSLVSIQNKIRTSSALSEEEEKLIALSGEAIIPMLSLQSAYSFSRELLNIEDFAEIIAGKILAKYLDGLLEHLKIAVEMKTQIEPELKKTFIEGLLDAKLRINYAIQSNLDAFAKRLDTIQKWKMLEKQLSGEVASDWKRVFGGGK